MLYTGNYRSRSGHIVGSGEVRSQRGEGNGNAMCLLRGFGVGDDLPGMWS